jgi:hypothetical protein
MGTTNTTQRLNKNKNNNDNNNDNKEKDVRIIHSNYDEFGKFVWKKNAASVDGEQQLGYSYVIVKNNIPWKAYETRDSAMEDILKNHLNICTVCKNKVKYAELEPFSYFAKCIEYNNIAIGAEAYRQIYGICPKFSVWISFFPNNVIREHGKLYVPLESDIGTLGQSKMWTAHQFHGTSDPNDVLIGCTVIRDPNNVLIDCHPSDDNDVPHQEEGFAEPSAPVLFA